MNGGWGHYLMDFKTADVRTALYLVTGAPGAGKSTTVEALLGLESPFVFFDIDWLAAPASALYGEDIRFAPESWSFYGELWFSVLHATFQNGLTPVLFTPSDPSDYKGKALPDWCSGLEWLLLDCADNIRLERLHARGWQGVRLTEAFQDAALMRELIPRRVDTGGLDSYEVAEQVLTWLRRPS